MIRVLVLLLAASAAAQEGGPGYRPAETEALAKIGAPASYAEKDPPPARQVQLGRKLFFDPRLSSDGTVSCATCHKPELSFTDGLPRARGIRKLEGRRNTPSLFNLSYRHSFFWDGRADSVEAALLDAIKNPVEMNQDPAALPARLAAVPGYAEEFRTVYGRDEIRVADLAEAIGAFVRTIDEVYARRPSAFDKFREDPSALSPSAREGLVIFAGKGRCITCHGSDHFADDDFHNVGMTSAPGLDDKGRAEARPGPRALRAFKTPSLRQVALTGPYMHDGRFADLRAVVDFFDRGGDEPAGRDPEIRPLGLTPREKSALVDFLQALTAPVPTTVVPTLPPSRG